MSYLDKNLLPDEQIKLRTKKHLIIFFLPAVWTLCALYFSWVFGTHVALYAKAAPIFSYLNLIIWVVWFSVLIFWGSVWLEYAFSEFAVTDRRVMMREGFFNRHAIEVRLSAIAQINIDQSLFGQICNYGTVSMNAFGAYDAFTLIARPGLFQKAVNEQLDKLVK